MTKSDLSTIINGFKTRPKMSILTRNYQCLLVALVTRLPPCNAVFHEAPPHILYGADCFQTSILKHYWRVTLVLRKIIVACLRFFFCGFRYEGLKLQKIFNIALIGYNF